MDSITIIVVLLAMISVLVVAHEWGHFIVARIFKIRVDDFSIGFGPRLLRLGKRGDTEYNIRAFPVGGFVKIAGMDADEEPLNKAREALLNNNTDTAETPLPPDEAPNTDDHFYSKPIWQRSLVILAGPAMSFIFGFLVFCFAGFTVGLPGGVTTARIAEVMPGGQAYRMGLRSGDLIQKINNQPIKNGDDMVDLIHMNYGNPLKLVVARGSQILTFTGTPQQLTSPVDDKPVYAQKVINPNGLAAAGVQPGDIIFQVEDEPVINSQSLASLLKNAVGKNTDLHLWRNNQEASATVKLTPAQLASLPTVSNFPLGMLKFQPMQAVQRVSFTASIKDGWGITSGIFGMIGQMFQRHHLKQLKDSTGGIVMMYSVTGLAVKNGLSQVIMTAGEISISLAIFNLLPIPILDGGHLLTFFIEWVRRGRRFTEQQQQTFLITGMAVIGILFVLIFTNDIHRLISHQIPQ